MGIEHTNQKTSPSTPDSHPVYYSRFRGDRSGAAIQDMLMCHAYLFARNVTYGGACGTSKHVQNVELLLNTYGLSQLLPLACPSDGINSSYIIDWNDYLLNQKKDTVHLTTEWQFHIAPYIRYPDPPPSFASVYTVVVHIRRGDVNPCCWPRRYIPNAYYQKLIDMYVSSQKTKYQVIIFTESTQFETMDDFVRKKYHVIVGGDLVTAWRHMMSADVFILSKSSFSFVPAILASTHKNKTRIVYTPFWHSPLPGWDVVTSKEMDRFLKQERKRLIQQSCTAAIMEHCENEKETKKKLFS